MAVTDGLDEKVVEVYRQVGEHEHWYTMRRRTRRDPPCLALRQPIPLNLSL